MAQPVVPRMDRRTLAMKLETAYADDAFGITPPAADDIQEVYNIQANVGPQVIDVPFIGGYLGSMGIIPGIRTAQITFEQMLRGAGATYTALIKPNFDLPMRACGFEATLTTGIWTYKPRSTAFESMTLYMMQENAPTIKMLGAFGDVQVTGQVGRPLMARYNFIGVYRTEEDTPTLVTKQFSPAPQWPLMLDTQLQIGTENFGACINQIQLNMNNNLDVQECTNEVNGITGVFFGGRRPGGSMDPEQVTRATYDWIAKWEQSTLADLSFHTNGPLNARIRVVVPRSQIRARPHGSRGQKATYNVTFDMIPLVGDDEWTIVCGD
jgi:hypothetical protein